METKLRTFIAIEIHPQFRNALKSFIVSLQQRFGRGFKWVRPENLHLTLRFIGDSTPDNIRRIGEVLAEISHAQESFILVNDGTGAFPNWKNARTFWIGFHQSPTLQALYRQMNDRLAVLGLPSERNIFLPHLTICRIADYCDPLASQQLSSELQSKPFAGIYESTISRLVFFKSILQPGGPIYTPLSYHPFFQSSKV